MIVPTLNLNGETAESHIEKRIKARQAIRTLMEKLGEMRPHGRDYLGDTEKYNAHLAIHTERIRWLDKLYNDLEEEAMAIHRQNEV